MEWIPFRTYALTKANDMVNTTEMWNNDLSEDNEEERELVDSEFEIEKDEPEAPHVYSPLSPYFNETLNKD